MQKGPEGPRMNGSGSSSKRTDTALLYSQPHVYLHPTESPHDNVAGSLSITQSQSQSSSTTSVDYLLSWRPQQRPQSSPPSLQQPPSSPEYENENSSYVVVQKEEKITAAVTTATEYASSSSIPSHFSTSYAFSIPIRSLYSIILQAPTALTSHGSISLHPVSEDRLPALYFHNEALIPTSTGTSTATSTSPTVAATSSPSPWGGERLIDQLRQYANVLRSQLEPCMFLINPSSSDQQVHSMPLFEDNAVPPSSAASTPTSSTAEGGNLLFLEAANQNGIEYPKEIGAINHNNESIAFSVFSSFSRITRGARSAAHSVLSHPLAQPLLKSMPPPTIAHLTNISGELSLSSTSTSSTTSLQERAGVGEFDSARIYLAKWARVVAVEGEKARKAEVLLSGPEGRIETEVGAFEVLSRTYKITRPKSSRASSQPIVATEWTAWFDARGKMMLPAAEAKRRIFQRGVAPGVRREVWPFLLNVFQWDSTTRERAVVRKRNLIEYQRLKRVWCENIEILKSTIYAEESHRIEIDCRRTDRTHPLFESNDLDPSEFPSPSPAAAAISDLLPSSANQHIRAMEELLLTYVFAAPARDYVQGMSDLLSPLYAVNATTPQEPVSEMDLAMIYFQFEQVMCRMESNFGRDQRGMKRQLGNLLSLIDVMDQGLYQHFERTGSLNLFFCFRWILCSFKRELSFDATLRLWENLWTDHAGTHFHLFLALAILEAHRDVIIRYLREFDEILKYINELSQTLDIDALLADAEVLYLTFQKVLQSSSAVLVSGSSESSTYGTNGKSAVPHGRWREEVREGREDEAEEEEDAMGEDERLEQRELALRKLLL